MLTDNAAAPKSRAVILVVEDDRTSRVALLSLLRLTGFDPLSASTLAEGQALLTKNPSCLILDLMLPDGNGSALLAHVRQAKLPICVVVTTGSTDYKAMLADSREPPDAVFSKPLDFDSLTRWLEAHCLPHG